MPVKINEVIIKAVVDNGSTTTPDTNRGITTSQATSDAEIAALVLEIIKEKNER